MKNDRGLSWVSAAFFAAAVVMASLPARAGYKEVLKPLPNDPMGVRIFELDNGLTVYITEYHEIPRFYSEIAVRAGSKNDPAESTGLAHYLEHMLFKGTEKLGTVDYGKEQAALDRISDLYEEHFKETDPAKREAIYAKINEASQEAAAYEIPNELDRVYSAMGATDVNAHTWQEETVYKVGLPANRLRQWAMLESERFADPVFRLFQTELETIYEEKNRALDSKDRVIYEALQKQLYKVHPYGQQPTIGLTEHLKNPSLKNIDTFYHTYYVPNNMAIFLSGDVDTEEAMKLIDEYFSRWEPRELPKPKEWQEPPLKGREETVVNYEGEEYIALAFRTAPIGSPDAETLRVIDMILDNATAGLINLNLVQSQRVRGAGSYPEMNTDYGAQSLYGVPKDGQSLDVVEQLLLEQLDIIKRGDFDDWLIEAIVNDLKKMQKGGLESNESRVSEMRSSWIELQPWEHRVGQIARLEQITKEDVVRVANKYFGTDYVAAIRKDAPHEVPDITKPAFDPINIDPTRQSEFATSLLAVPVEPLEPEYVSKKDFEKKADKEGVTFYYVPNPVNDIFTMSITVDYGTRQDNLIGMATELLDKSGTSRLSPEELQKEWYKLGTDFGIGAGDNETTITLRGLDENFDASVALLMEVLTDAQADKAVLEELKKIVLVTREDQKKQAPAISQALVQYNRYGENSSFLRLLPSEDIMALETGQLLGVIKNLLGFKHSISYTGSLPSKKVRSILEKRHPVSDKLKDPPPFQFYKARSPEHNEIYFVNKETAQSSIRMEIGSFDYNPDWATEIDMYNEYFAGGMGGIVFQELREARALAYVAAARYIEGYRVKDQNLMVGLVQTQCDKTVEASKGLAGLLDELPQSEERYAVAKEAIINRYRTGKIPFRGILGAVRSWERLGLEPDPRKKWFGEIQDTTLDEVTAFQKEYIANKPKLISIVGDETKIDTEALSVTVGPVKKIGVDTIFVE